MRLTSNPRQNCQRAVSQQAVTQRQCEILVKSLDHLNVWRRSKRVDGVKCDSWREIPRKYMSKRSALKQPSDSSGGSGQDAVGKVKKAVSLYLTSRFLGQLQLQNRFLEAADANNFSEIKICVQKGVDPNVIHPIYGIGAIHIAAERGDTTLAFKLLSGLPVNYDLKTAYGFTPLILTAIFHRKTFALMLLQRGANPNLPDNCDRTPMHFCITHASYGVLYLLWKYKANVNVIDAWGNTPLSLSLIDNPNIAVAKTLLRSYKMEEMEKLRPMHIFFECILNCRSHGQIEHIILLLDNGGVDINMKETFTKRNCLHFVAITGYLHLALVLVERGADLQALDYTKRTPLAVAQEHGNYAIVDYLYKGYKTPNPLKVLTFANSWRRKLSSKRARESEAEPSVPQSIQEQRDYSMSD